MPNLNPNEKIFLVSHSWFLKLWTGVWNEAIDFTQDNIKDPDESTWMLNCEFIPDDVNFNKNKLAHPEFPDRVPEYDIDDLARGP